MLTEVYIEAFDEELADKVWEAWFGGDLNDVAARIAWTLVACLDSREH